MSSRFRPLALACLFALSALTTRGFAQNEDPPAEPPPAETPQPTDKPATPERVTPVDKTGRRIAPRRDVGASKRPNGDKPENNPAAGPEGGTRVALEVGQGNDTWGTIVIELDEQHAPLSARNFLQYVDSSWYDGTIFHRVLNGRDFNISIIQGGGQTIGNQPKRDGVHEPVQSESRNGLKNVRGTIAVARGSAPHSGTSQFFINVTDNPELDYPAHDGTGYTVFGKVVEGMEVVDRIKDGRTRPRPEKRDESSLPFSPVVIKKAHRLGAGEDAEAGATRVTPPGGGMPPGRLPAPPKAGTPARPATPEGANPPPNEDEARKDLERAREKGKEVEGENEGGSKP